MKSHRQRQFHALLRQGIAGLIGLLGLFPLASNGQGKDGGSGDPESLFYGYATQYFRWRCDHAGSNSLYLNAIADSKAFDRFSLDWYKGLSEPRHFLRIGIGVSYTAKNYDGPLLIVGSSSPGSASGAGGRGGDADSVGLSGVGSGLLAPPGAGVNGSAPGSAGGGSTDAPAEDEDPAEFLKRYGGPLAESLVRELDSRRKLGKGKFGSVLKMVDDVVLKSSADSDSGAADSGAGADGPAEPEFVRPQRSSAGVGGGIPPMAAPNGTTGSAGPTGDEDEGKDKDKDKEADEEGDDAAGEESGDKDKDAAAEEPDSLEYELDMSEVGGEPTEEFRSVHPGVVCLNQGTREELVERARSQAVDLLFVIDVTVRETSGTHYSMTNVRLIDMQEPTDVVAQTKAIRSDADLAAEDRKSGKNLVETELGKVFDAVDQSYTASALPESLKAKPEHVANRVSRLVSAANDGNRLMIGAEIAGFFRKGLLGDSEAAAALGKLFEGGGNLLLSGEKEDRLAFLKKIMQESE